MSLETATFINSLVSTNPASNDPKSQGDDHLRLIKSVLQNSFTAITGAVTKTHTELNSVTDRGLIAGQVWTGTHTFPATTYGVTAAPGSSGTGFATIDYANALAFSSALPAQTGNSGKFLTTDGSIASWSAIPAQTGIGGTTITGNVTLTSASQGSIVVTPASNGLYATLPDATTLSEGMSQFAIYNAGEFDYGIKDSSGVQLGWIRPRTGGSFGLADNATIAGVWNLANVEKFGVTAELSNNSITFGTSGVKFKVVALDATRYFFAFGELGLYGVVYDSSTQTWGSVTLLKATIRLNAFGVAKSATDQLLLIAATTTTNVSMNVLTISGTGITVGTAVNKTVLTAATSVSTPVLVGSSMACGYYTGTTNLNSNAFAVTISGTVPTSGSDTIIANATSGPAPIILASGSIARYLTGDGYITPYTVSGTTLTLGTASANVGNSVRYTQLANGNIFGLSVDTGQITITSLTGTVETRTTLAPTTTLTGNVDIAKIETNKVVMVGYASATTTLLANIYTDTSGTISKGTEIIVDVFTAGLTNVVALGVVGTTAYFAATSVSAIGFYSINCSGSSPTVTRLEHQHKTTQPPTLTNSLNRGSAELITREVGSVANGGTGIVFGGSTPLDIKVSKSSPNWNGYTGFRIMPVAWSLTGNENWIFSYTESKAAFNIKHIEAAA